MKLSSGTLTIELRPLQAVDDEDWVRVQVLVAANGFRGDFETWLQLGDLVQFRAEIDVMYASAGQAVTAVLSSAEPDIEIRLKMQPLGTILGTYALESGRPSGTPTALSGAFEIDQSYLPSLRDAVAALLSALSESPVPEIQG